MKVSKLIIRSCEFCNSEFNSYRPQAKYCSVQCIGKAKAARSGSLADRLSAHSEFATNGCIEWTSGKDRKGYGIVKFWHHPLANAYGNIPAHRAAYYNFYGDIPAGMCVCHECDNPKCINVNHLFLGTQKDNNDDKVSKRRHAFGSKHYRTSLTEEKVALIKQFYLQGMTPTPLSERFVVPVTTIENIVYGGKWAHVKPATVDRLEAYCEAL